MREAMTWSGLASAVVGGLLGGALWAVFYAFVLDAIGAWRVWRVPPPSHSFDPTVHPRQRGRRDG